MPAQLKINWNAPEHILNKSDWLWLVSKYVSAYSNCILIDLTRQCCPHTSNMRAKQAWWWESRCWEIIQPDSFSLPSFVPACGDSGYCLNIGQPPECSCMSFWILISTSLVFSCFFSKAPRWSIANAFPWLPFTMWLFCPCVCQNCTLVTCYSQCESSLHTCNDAACEEAQLLIQCDMKEDMEAFTTLEQFCFDIPDSASPAARMTQLRKIIVAAQFSSQNQTSSP